MIAKNRKDLRRTERELQKNTKNRYDTKNALEDVREAQRELQIFRQLRELQQLRKFAKISERPNENYENCENTQTYQESLKHVRGSQRELSVL